MTALADPGASTARPAMPLFGIGFSERGREQIVDTVSAAPAQGQGLRFIVTANLDHIVQLQDNARLRQAYDHAWLRTIDGTPVFLYARFRRARVPERVTGADLVPELMRRMMPGTHRPFFVVATEEIGEGITSWAAEHGFAPDAVDYVVPPYRFEADADYGFALAERIRKRGTTHLFFGVGCPKSEIWLDEHRTDLGDCYGFAVGAGIAFFLGIQRRAPALFQKVGMEWLWRLGQEPQRLARRYLVQSWGFLGAVIEDLRKSQQERT